jgi:hypothetical protein
MKENGPGNKALAITTIAIIPIKRRSHSNQKNKP